LWSRKEAEEGVSSDALKGTDGASDSYSLVFVFIVVLYRGYRCVWSARAILLIATSAYNFRQKMTTTG